DTVRGSQTVLSGGVDSGTSVAGGGIETIQAGGTGINTQVGDNSLALVTSGGLEIVSATGSGYDYATSVTIGSGGSAVVDANAYASGLFVLSGGSMTVQGGGWASGTQVGSAVSGNFVVSSGGEVTVASGAWADNTNVWADGVQTVQSGAAVSNTVVFNRGTEMMQSGATETATLVASGGTDVIAAGATASGDFTFGGTISVGGTASDTMVSGGSETVLAGGSSVDDTATFGGSVTVSSGGVAFAPRIGSAGTLVLDAGAVVSGAISYVAGSGGIVGSNGILVISGTTMPTNIISGFDLRSVSQGDTIDLASVPFATGGTVSLGAGNVLSVTEGGSTYALQLDPNQTFTSQSFEMFSDGHGGTAVVDDINPLCYAAGTRLATPAGEVAVENLQAGDAVLALQDGAWTARTVRWVGRFTVDLARHPNPRRAAPIRIRAHAFAPNVPSRDLFLSPDHSVFVDGALMQAQALLNGASVVQEFPDRITYLHVELDRHAVLLAEGLAAESFLDTGNRALFAGEAGTRALHPDLASAEAWDERACAPLLLGGSRVAAEHRRLRERAEALGWVRAEDAGLMLTVDGQAVTPDAAGRLRVPAGARELRLVSRSFVPAWLGLGPDRRRLGVAVTTLRFGGRTLPRAAFAAGWHAAEQGLRWTDGDARLILPRSDRPAALRIAFGTPGAVYWQTEANAPARARAV
ncbi:MAG TPA: Hint domain-containing protein, partial [Acetobacteraceae bacterium]|nr:Hint domain-containing protein [Acetobacteraceae bacterium]